jgi:hypothetical protein
VSVDTHDRAARSAHATIAVVGTIRASWALAMSTVLACGRVDFTVLGDGARPPPDLITLDALGAFTTPSLLTNVSLAGVADDDPELTPDLLELYFSSDRPGGPGGSDVWVARRASASDPFGTPTVVTELSSPASESQPTLCCGGLVIYLSSNRAPSLGSNDLFRASRAVLGAPWSTPVHVPELSSTAYDGGGTTTTDDLEIIFDTDRASGFRELYRATRGSPTSPWSTPTRIEELVPPAAGNDVDPNLASDNVLLYSSTRTGSVGMFDLWLTVRDDASAPFGAPINLTELNTADRERDPWLSADGRVVLFARGATTDVDIYMATR